MILCYAGVFQLTHWGRVTHICVSEIIITGSDNGLSPGRRQAIIWTNAGILLIGPLGINFSEILIKINTFHSRKCIWKHRLRNGGHFVSGSIKPMMLLVSSRSLINSSFLCFHYYKRHVSNIYSKNYGDFHWVYRQISNISRTKSQNLNSSHLVLQLSLCNILKPCVKSRMKM